MLINLLLMVFLILWISDSSGHLSAGGGLAGLDHLDVMDMGYVDSSMPTTPVRRLSMQSIPSNQDSKENKEKEEG